LRQKAFDRKVRKDARKVRKGEAFSTQTPVHCESTTVNDEQRNHIHVSAARAR
jgi:hypothetical protein